MEIVDGLPDITGRADITALVTDFYTRAFADDLLGPVFLDVARMDLATHLPIMCDFWETVLFRSGTYQRNPLRPHVELNRREPLTERHFRRWLELWCGTVDDRHAGPKAELAKGAGESDRRRDAAAAGRRRTPHDPLASVKLTIVVTAPDGRRYKVLGRHHSRRCPHRCPLGRRWAAPAALTRLSAHRRGDHRRLPLPAPNESDAAAGGAHRPGVLNRVEEMVAPVGPYRRGVSRH
ncbi:group III truncated hemoglobin [Micromonospora sp. WMMA1363]|uniref:group III truncated hemoglobin n=1 Tax=Micromonospora sp. WMMA1363 TaxID=3053985 RepID=UPI00259CC039|nr:group III truncated hemoglobin [Micromonospora sp. WMMA1363]MDM4718689.1 group III truncated hemoglobin [Micromonospora sp. WMMA1363]